MFCFKCGASMPDQSAVCPQCGAAVANAPQPASSSPGSPPPVSPYGNVPPAQPGYPGQPQQTDGKATTSMILGILSITCLGVLAGIPAVILGHISKSNINKSMGRLKGEGLATAGLVMGYLSIFFSLIIIPAIVIPSLLRARQTANESAARSTVRTLNTSEITYSTAYPSAGYARDLATLGPGPSGSCPGTEGTKEHACLIDATLGCTSGSWCTKYQYNFNLTGANCEGGACTDYVIVATPIGSGGNKRFCSTSDAVVRSQIGGSMVTPPTVEECQSWNPL